MGDAIAADLLQVLSEAGHTGGRPDGLDVRRTKPVEEQPRLLFHGVPLRLGELLSAQGVHDGSEIRFMPALQCLRNSHVPAAPRGLLLAPGNKPWAPKLAN